MSAATLAAAAPGRFVLGVGSSSNVIVERWNGVPFEAPYQRVRDTVRFVRAAMTGEKVTEKYETFAVDGFRMGFVPPEQPAILVAALRSGMLRLAGREADGAIVNWLAPERRADGYAVRPCRRSRQGDRGADLRGADRGRRGGTRRCPVPIAAYLTVPVYRAFHDWLGRTEVMRPMQEAWAAGDRKGALAAIPDELVDSSSSTASRRPAGSG